MIDSRTLIFLLILGVVYLINRLLENAGKRSSRTQAPAPASVGEQPERDVAEDASVRVRPRRMQPKVMPRSGLEPGMSAADSRFAARHLVTGRENLRRAVIAMTVLGTPAAMRPGSAPPGGAPE